MTVKKELYEAHLQDNIDAENRDDAPQLDALAYEAGEVADALDDTPQAVQERAEQEEQEAEDSHAGAELSAGFIVMMAENTALSIWPFLEFQEEQKQRTVELLVPVIEKHGGELPPWLANYKEELMLGGHLALMFVMARAQIKKEERRLDEEAKKREAANEEGNGAPQEAAA